MTVFNCTRGGKMTLCNCTGDCWKYGTCSAGNAIAEAGAPWMKWHQIIPNETTPSVSKDVFYFEDKAGDIREFKIGLGRVSEVIKAIETKTEDCFHDE